MTYYFSAKLSGASFDDAVARTTEALQGEGFDIISQMDVQETGDGVEVAAIDPVASMQAIQNKELGEKAAAVADKLRRAVETLAR